MMDSIGFSAFVRNEMSCLPALLDLIKGLFGDVVVFDTGSDDGTWEMLREREKAGELRPYRLGIPFDAKHFHYGYARSVAAHLNQCAWVMMLDADERMTEEELPMLETWVERAELADKKCVAFPRYNWQDGPPGTHYPIKSYPDLQVRCVKNDGTVWWRRAVHEVVKLGPNAEQVPWVTADIHIHHFHAHFRKSKGDDGSFLQVYDELTKSDPDWMGTY